MWTRVIILILAVVLGVRAEGGFKRSWDPQQPRVEDRLAIENLMTQYCSSVDQRNREAYMDVFTEDAILDYSANGPFVGKGNREKMYQEAILDGLNLFGVSAHRWSNMEITFTGDRSSKLRVMLNNPLYVSFFPVFPLITVHAYYNHELVKDPVTSQWRSKGMSMEVYTQGHLQALALIAIIAILYRTRRSSP